MKKPPNLSSAQVLRELQHKFARSKTFAPLLQDTRRKQDEQDRHQRKRRKTSDGNVFKMGHGGTLDPMATGVLIVGIGRGTKHLNEFLGCTKTYDTVVLFGKGTDTYDVAGKIVSDAPHDHVTRNIVEENLATFRGKIKQVPPIYSALKIEGMKAYEYARTGKELPRELESREMDVRECTLLDWQEGGKHNFRWPAAEASEEDKAVARKLMKRPEVSIRDQPGVVEQAVSIPPKDARTTPDRHSRPSSPSRAEMNKLSPSDKAALHTHEQTLSEMPADGPAATIRLTVSSGFYVRSFAHDLGLACNSYGTMAALLRSRQGDYTCTDAPFNGLVPCLTYAELNQGEETWGPKLSKILRSWLDKNPVAVNGPRIDDRDRSTDPRDSSEHRKSHDDRRGNNQQRQNDKGDRWSIGKRKHTDGGGDARKRRNSSSPE